MKRCSAVPIITEIQIKSTMKYHLIPSLRNIIKKTKETKYWPGYEKGTLCTVDGNANVDAATVEKHTIPSKV